MTRLWSCGFELQSTTNGMEWATGTNGSPAIETTIKHGGAAALRINNTAAAENVIHLYRSTQGPHWSRTYFHIVSEPNSTRQFVTLLNSSNVKIGVRIMSGVDARKLQLFNEEDIVQIGSNSIQLTAGLMYRLEIGVDDTTLSSTSVEARLYAANNESTLLWNPSGTADLTASPNRFRLGTNGADSLFDVIYDDCAINDNSGSYQNSWCGEESLVIMRPDGNSGSPQWARGGTDSGANWSQVEEVTPDDVTTYVESNTNNQVDEYTLEATPAAIGSHDTITWVGPSVRFAISATTGADPDFVIGLKDGSNFDETGNLSGAGSTTYVSHQTASPLNYPALGNNSNYEVPGTSSPYTKSILDSLIFRLRETVTDTHFVRVSAVWVYVGYKPNPTRFYLPSTGDASVSPSFNGGWEETSDADRRKMVTTRISSSMTDKTANTLISAGDTLIRQYVSDPLEAQTIDATVHLYVRAAEALATVDAVSRILLKVVSNDGSSVTGTLLTLADYSSGAEWNTSLRNKAFADGDTPSSVACSAGDRLVLEIGFNHGAVVSSGTLNFGDNSATDLPQDETTTTADNPWLEIRQVLTFQAAGGRTTKNTDPRPLGQFVGISRTMINPPV